ncbi:hypothetical protein LTR08_005497 [Meristemomyces frigidus]|nr:hypothetical protein LTR08_005497 [Meristemomyces frigidus]
MNKFLNRKKTPEGGVTATDDAYNALTSPPLPSSGNSGNKKSATSRWKKSKKQPEPMPEQLNIAAALPASDDFRTSLLMPNLSARFSMLREQDDPNSLLGKASDDSVLQPRRRSRMLEYGFGSNGLNDIAEVRSINSSIRPPFASYSTQKSYGSEDGYGSENESTLNGSMMTRARPGEGNVLFGGRQKVYKIPLSGAASSARLGKAVYGDDIGTSAFQKHRKDKEEEERRLNEEQEARMASEEREVRRSIEDAEVRVPNEDQGFDFGLDETSEQTLDPADAGVEDQCDAQTATPNDSAKDLSHSPSTSSYNKKRSTTSSTTRSEARSSTPATSVASQPMASAPAIGNVASPGPAPTMPLLKRADTKTRRLYEQGLDQHMYEQQTTALTRLNSIQRQRSLHQGKQPSPFLQSAKSAGNIHEHVKQPVFALRAQSPPTVAPLAPLAIFGSMRNPSSNNASPITSGPQSPVSPQAMDFDDATPLNQALDPNDRGKATAMGFFDKPARQFDEKQYMERQQHLQRSLSKPGKDSAAFQARIGRFEQIVRERSTSDASTRSRSRSAPKAVPKSLPKRGDSLRKKREPTQAYNVFQNAASAMPTKPGAQQYDTHRTFFGNISASDSEEEEDEQLREGEYQGSSDFGYGGAQARWQPTALPSVSEHPALRSQLSRPSLLEEEDEDEDGYLEPEPLQPMPSSHSLRQEAERVEGPAAVQPDVVDSPTLGPSNSEPLNGMMHHLRNKSNGSSLYPNDEGFPVDVVPELPDMSWNARSPDSGHPAFRSTMDSDSRIDSTYTNSNSNPWDLDDMDNVYDVDDSADRCSTSPVDGARSRTSFARAPSRAAVQTNRQSEASQYSEVANGPAWQNELRRQHTRDASTATQQERDAFANELATRRNAIQENIKSMVERDTQSRNVSPAPSSNGAFKAFGMLRSRSSRESVDVSRGPSAPTKAMKMLGIGANPSTTTLGSQYERSGLSFDVTRTRENSVSRVPPLPSAVPRAPQPSEWETRRARGDSETGKPGILQPSYRSPASSQAGRARSRSNSGLTTGRSRSRTGPYRDDLERAMVEGMGSSAAGHPELSPLIPHELTPKPSPDIMQNQSDARPRARSNSRPPVANNYFDPKHVLPVHPAAQGRQMPSGPSPITLSPNVYSPTNKAIRSPPAASPITPMPTPPVSSANTPQGSNFAPHPNMPNVQPRTGILRKKTISKSSISEPTLISSTSTMDTVDLPEGASLRNGMESPPPPLPPVNPRRRGGTRKVFGLGRSNVSEDAIKYGNYGRSKTPDPWMSRTTPEPDFSFAPSARQASEGRPNIHPQQGFENHSTPALQQYGYQPPAGSPARAERPSAPQHPGAMEGGMF